MVLVRRIHNRGANIVVEANGEVLFFPTGDVANWQRRFSARVREFSAAEAPVNRRPRWAHYGKPLRATFTASTTAQPGRMKVYSAVGSTAPHAYYVDQGTGIYGGRGPYKAKILPPWHQGSPSLYEHTWKVPQSVGENTHGEKVVEWTEVGSVEIKGQKGQHFFDKGLKRGFQSMRMRSIQVPGEGSITQALATMPTGLLGFLGNTPNTPAFRAQLDEWRLWRDAAWRAKQILGEGVRNEHLRRHAKARRAEQARARKQADSLAQKRRRSAERSKRYRDRVKSHREKTHAEKPDRKKTTRLTGIQKARAAAKREMAAFFAKNRGFRFASVSEAQGGFYYFDRGGTRKFHAFSMHTGDLFANAGVKFHAPPKHT